MKSVFNPSDNREILDRIATLRPDSRSEWGKMGIAQMLAHTNITIRVAFGDVKLKRSFLGMLIGSVAKKSFTGTKPFERNSPTDKHFIMKDQYNFEEEKRQLLELVGRFAKTGPSGLTNEAHPFFGTMNTQEWDALMWNHLDHHLRQFGA